MDYPSLMGHLAGHLASILTMLAYLLKDILWLRALTILSCFAGIAFNYFVPATPLWQVIGWNILFAIINIVQVAIIIKQRSGVHFTEEEKELHDTLFKNFAPFEFMKLMRVGKWLEAKQGEILATEKKPIDSVMLIYNGLVGVESKGKEVAKLKDGNFIGEVSFITGGAATATVKGSAADALCRLAKGSDQPAFESQPQHEIRNAGDAQHGFEQEADAPRAVISGQDRSGFYLQT